MRLVFAMVAMGILSACATDPDRIAPMPVSTAQFSGMSCSQANTRIRQIDAQLAPMVQAQRAEASADAGTMTWGILFCPICGAAVAGGGVDYASQIAQLRGERNTLAAMTASCG